MAMGSSFSAWALASMASMAMLASDYVYDTGSSMASHASFEPWRITNHSTPNGGGYSANLENTARRALLIQQAASRYASDVKLEGPIELEDITIASSFQIDGWIESCRGDTSGRAACILETDASMPGMALASMINELYGAEVSGVWNSDDLVTPTNNIIPVPSGFNATSGQVVISK